MRYEILKTNGFLRITADDEERAELKRRKQELSDEGRFGFGMIDEFDALESLVVNSELDWTPEGATGDLTSAPMLGITQIKDAGDGYREHELASVHHFGKVLAGGDAGGEYYSAIIARWAYMNYQVRSFLDDFIEQGYADFEGGYANQKDAEDLTPGDRLDMEHDKFAGDPTWEFEVGIVEFVEPALNDLIVVSFTNGNVIAFPKRHRVTLAEAAQ